MKLMTRRGALTAGAALPFAGALGTVSRPAFAQGRMAENARKRGFMLGDFEVSTLLAGTRTVENPQDTFGMNVSAEEFAEVSRNNFIPADKTQFFFTPTLVNTGEDVVLFDTGLNAEGTVPALEQAGYSPEDVTVVVLTHMHGDHIGGLTDASGAPTYANARYVTGQAEFDHWAGQDNEGFDTKVRPLAEKMTFLGDGDSVVSGVTGIALTKLDVLDGFDEIKVCVAYRLNGETIDHYPAGLTDQAAVEPVYETLQGWKGSTAGARSWADLPAEAVKYVRRLEELVGKPCALVSTSPEREDVILMKDPFEG